MPALHPVSTPILSVVVPTHNVRAWVVECLKSIAAQELPLEVIVVDDHSEDGTLELARAFAKSDPRFTIVEAVSFGGAHARNQGLSLATGEYIVFADGDDIVPDGAYAALLGSLRESGSDMAIGNFLKFSTKKTWEPGVNWRVFEEDRRGVTLAELPQLIRGRAVWSKMFLRQFWDSLAAPFPEVPRSNDIGPITAALVNAKSIDIVRNVVYLYRERPGAGSMTAKASRATALLSYLQQEYTCAESVVATQSDPIVREYFSLFFRADGWVHLNKYLSGDGRAVDDANNDDDTTESARLVSEFIRLAATTEWPRLPAEKKRVFHLFALGRLDLLALLDETGNIGYGEPKASVEAYRSLFDDTEQLRHATWLDPGFMNIAMRDREITPLLAAASELDASVVRLLAAEIARYREAFLSTASLDLDESQEQLLKFAAAGEIDKIVRLSAMLKTARPVGTQVRFDGHRLEVDVELSGSVERTAAVVARRRGTDDEWTTELTLEQRDESLAATAVVPASSLKGNGTWDFSVRVADGGVHLSTLLRINRKVPRTPAGRTAPVVVYPVRRAGYALVVVRRPPIVKRALIRLATTLQPAPRR